MSDLARLVQASAHDLPMIESESVQCIVSSPPYFGLRVYDGAQAVAWPQMEYAPMAGLPPITVPEMNCALGNESTLEAYIGHLMLCLREWRRVLKQDGVCWVNLGDSYVGALSQHREGGSQGDTSVISKKTMSGIPQSGRIARGKALREGGLKPKDLMLVPARFALAAQADGWYLRAENIWHKPNPMPESVTDRPTKAHEYIYLLAKQERYFYDADAVKEPFVSEPTKRRERGTEASQSRAIGQSQQAGVYGTDGRNLRSVWTVALQPYSGAHFACFPPALIEPMIKAGSRVGDVVADFFSGSGTTGREAIRLGRKYLGVDLSEKYLTDLTPERLTVQMELGA